ncbi:MAG TPA: 5-methyltetrahydropteroyltriglutamate--homocysteine S-methyltransferase [bacterium]|nr:5-methyltetrahydropteroyltriglutamate--homocysteine S-methyltransferase [bacterium]HPN43152.1 5-methyltetrahydropteroyltriglutamate--homocysteine S-methyltransferase [bacterium]
MPTKSMTNILGYPRIGLQRELKKATEAYWNQKISADDLIKTATALRMSNWHTQKQAGIDLIPSNDFSFYDHMLDMSCLLGAIPPRFQTGIQHVSMDLYFSIARGVNSSQTTSVTHASEMTKWFDTNYHYIVPELHHDMEFKISTTKVFDEFSQALQAGIKTKPVLVGPVTWLMLGKIHDDIYPNFNKFDLLSKLLPVYKQILLKLETLGVEWVQLDEPVFALDLTGEELQALKNTYTELAGSVKKLRLMVATYFGELRDNLTTFVSLPVSALHYDAVRGGDEIDRLLTAWPEKTILSLGVVDGRNIWKTDFEKSLNLLNKAKTKLGAERLMVAPSCSMLHSPVSLKSEKTMDEQVKNWLSFAEEKLAEVVTLAKTSNGDDVSVELAANRVANKSRRTSARIHNPAVQQRCAAVKKSDLNRHSAYSQRRNVQRTAIPLPEFPTTTIGSFPQTTEVRAMRARYKKSELTLQEYENYLQNEIEQAVRKQEQLDIDMLVHGEFERNDMVEYFGEQLAGFTFSGNGWVQSFGSRYVKPPIIFGDVSRPEPMTVRWSHFAQSLTKRPMKGMLTGPVTILQWSFVRDDQPRSETAKQIALALRDEVLDLEKVGIRAIQIDEPAIREGLPLRKADWPAYLEWAVNSFKLCASGVHDETQIHTHMCYSEFNDIIDSIAALDADVISIETSRSNMELLDAFVEFHYPNEIGPGVYDIHSPRVPETREMVDLLLRAKKVLPPENIWVNPDCGLKTRQWPEVMLALQNMVEAAKQLRNQSK